MFILKWCGVLGILVYIIFKYFKDVDFLYYIGKLLLFLLLIVPLNAFWAWENSVDSALYSKGFDDMKPIDFGLVQILGGGLLAFVFNRVKLR